MARKPKQETSESKAPRLTNRKARFKYHIMEVVEAGMELVGTEVKSLRAASASMDEAYVRVRGGDAVLVGMNISTYAQAAAPMQHDEKRDRRLLLHRRQIMQLAAHVKVKGNTVVPLSVYFKHGWAKCELGLAVGKQQFDKRRTMQERQQKRDIAREMHKRSRERE
jgi:SsrA-binding protein